jgi:arsenite methyltransferase
MSTQRPDYGLDAPLAIFLLLIGGISAGGLALTLHRLAIPYPQAVLLAEIVLGIATVNCLLVAIHLRWYSKWGKLRQRDLLLELIPWRGDEYVLDIGCGRGLLLLDAARRLTAGKAIGIDSWRWVDLAGNRPEAARENARRAEVADRVEVTGGDAQCLPFADASFDVIVSSAALHNIPGRAGRQQALREIARVLKPGGRLALLELRHSRACIQVLSDCGLFEARRALAGWFFSGLFALTTWGSVRFYRVTARKPLAADGESNWAGWRHAREELMPIFFLFVSVFSAAFA